MDNLVFGAAVTAPEAIKTAFSTGIQTATDYATDMISTALPLGIGLFAIVFAVGVGFSIFRRVSRGQLLKSHQLVRGRGYPLSRMKLKGQGNV